MSLFYILCLVLLYLGLSKLWGMFKSFAADLRSVAVNVEADRFHREQSAYDEKVLRYNEEKRARLLNSPSDYL